MVDTVANSEQVLLTYKDVSDAHPEWSDSAVEDYLSTKRDIVEATDTADKAVDTSNSSVLVPALMQQLERASFETVEVNADFTTKGNMILVCNNVSEVLITLNPFPRHKEQLIVIRNGKGRVSVTSNKTISGKVTKKILRQYTAPHHIYTTEADAWNVI